MDDHQVGFLDARRAVGGNAFAGFWLAVRDPYLLAIVGMLLAYSATSTVIYTDQASIVAGSVADSTARTALFATIDLWEQKYRKA